MINTNVEKLLLELFNEDHRINNGGGYISNLATITIKSLIPMKGEIGVRIDYRRFMEELKLWFHYRSDENPSLLNLQGRIDPIIYWKGQDDSIISRIIPIVVANQKYEIIEEEIVKNILYTSGNISDLFQGISLGYLLYEIINQGEGKDLISNLKEKLINFPQIDYINQYKSNYRIGIEHYPDNFKVDFERARIQILNILYGIKDKSYLELADLVQVLKGEKAKEMPARIVSRFLRGDTIEYKLPKFYLNLGDYIINLKKSRIDSDRLEIKEYILPDIFSYEEGELFFHSLLRESKIIKKEVSGDTLTSLVQTKTGMYLFRK